jgi:hypothetical protein
LTDAASEGQTGWMHEAANNQDLADQLDARLQAPTQLKRMGEFARVNVELVFEQSLIKNAMLDFYMTLLKKMVANDD